EGHEQPVRSLVVRPDGRTLISACADRIREWGLASGKELAAHPLDLPTQPRHTLCLSEDGQTLLTVENVVRNRQQGLIRIWDAATGEERKALTTTPEPLCGALSPDGRLLAVSFGKGVVLFDAESGEELATLKGHARPETALAFSPDGRTLAAGG